MSDYIKREDALELFEMVLDFYKDAGIQNIKTMVAIAPQEFHLSEGDEIADFNFELDGWRNDFMKIESADVAPVKHGHWQITDAYPHNVYCSECHTKYAQTHWAVWEDGSLPRRFCPNCGAKMDKENEQ